MRHPTFQPSFQCICLFCTWWHMVFDQQMCDIFMRAYGSSTDICVWLCYVHWEETIVSKRKAIKPVQLKSRICYELLYIQFQTSLWSPSYFVKSELNHYESLSGKAKKWPQIKYNFLSVTIFENSNISTLEIFRDGNHFYHFIWVRDHIIFIKL